MAGSNWTDDRHTFTVGETDTDFIPCILRFTHGRILSGWTMGEGMVLSVPRIEWLTDADDAWESAREDARIAADAEAQYQYEQDQEDESDDSEEEENEG